MPGCERARPARRPPAPTHPRQSRHAALARPPAPETPARPLAPAPALPGSLCSPMHRNGCESGIDTQPPHTLGAGNITLNTAPSPLAAAKPAAAPIGPGPSIVLTRELRRLGAARDTSLRIERARKYKSEWREPGGGGMQSSEAAARRRTANRERRGPPPPARRRRGPRAPEAAPRPLRGAPAHGPRGSAERDAAPRAFARLFRSAAAPSAAPLPGGGRPGGGAGCRVPRGSSPRPAARRPPTRRSAHAAVPGVGRGVRLLRWDQFSRGGVPPAGGCEEEEPKASALRFSPWMGRGRGGGVRAAPPPAPETSQDAAGGA